MGHALSLPPQLISVSLDLMRLSTLQRIVVGAVLLGASVGIGLFAYWKITGVWFDDFVLWIYPGSVLLMAAPHDGSGGTLLLGALVVVSIIENAILYAALAAVVAASLAQLRGGITRGTTREV